MNVSLESLKIVLVEPSTTQERHIERCLHTLGIRHIHGVVNGELALQVLSELSPDLVISAMHLPDMTGTDLILKIRTGDVCRNVPFMLISSETHYRYLEPIRQAGVIATLPKPFSREQLEKSIYAVLDYIDPEELRVSDRDLEEIKVLLVDDSETSRRHIRLLLSRMGVEQVTEVDSGPHALEEIEQEFFDLIVTDYHMPEMDGKELVECIRTDSKQSSVPILMVSGENDSQRLAAVRQAGVSAICDKPFEPMKIKSLIERIIN